MNEVYNPLSYASIQNSLKNFRQFRRDEFNIYDEPGTFWFKPIFYFYRSTVQDNQDGINTEGLLHPSWLVNGNKPELASAKASAYNYLSRNDEPRRAEMLQKFVELLSNIASRSPWYFQEVAGLDTAVDHSEAFTSGKFVTDTRKQISFTLLPDSVDTRVGTLIDLYRTICYSWKTKREIVPANLRKFDMGIYIFGSMIQNDNSNVQLKKDADGNNRILESKGEDYVPNTQIVDAAGNVSTEPYKSMNNIYLEFTNCEINLSSTKGGDTVNNAEGSERKYTLVIDYDDCFVNRYNNAITELIGDCILDDLITYHKDVTLSADGGTFDIQNVNVSDEISNATVSIRGPKYKTGYNQAGFMGRSQHQDAVNLLNRDRLTDKISKALGNVAKKSVLNAASSVISPAIQTVRNTVGAVLLGNLYTGSLDTSLTKVASGRLDALGGAVKTLTSQDTWSRAGEQFVDTAKNSIKGNIQQFGYNVTNKQPSSSATPNQLEQNIGNDGNISEAARTERRVRDMEDMPMINMYGKDSTDMRALRKLVKGVNAASNL